MECGFAWRSVDDAALHAAKNRAPLEKICREVMKHIHRLWSFDVYMEQVNDEGNVELIERWTPL